jgi:hypothetical protein
MIQLRKLTLALPFAFAVAACSSNRSSGDTGTAAGTIANDTAAARLDTNPAPGVLPADTSKKLMPTDTSMRDSMRMDTTKRDSTRKHRAGKRGKKPY